MIDMRDHIRESNLIEGIDSEQADKDCLIAWEALLHCREITHSVVMQLQAMITKHQDDLYQNEKGNYRRIQVYVGNHVPPAPHLVAAHMDNFLHDFMAMDPIEAHIRFETIHPFVDGNGRTGRMLLWWHQLANNQKPTCFYNDQKQSAYYPLFSSKRDL